MSTERVFTAAKAFLKAYDAPGGVEVDRWTQEFHAAMYNLRLEVLQEQRYRERLGQLALNQNGDLK